MFVEHRCGNCPTMLRYDQRTRRRVWCEGCGPIIRKANRHRWQKMVDQRHGRARRGCIRGRLAQIERAEAHL